MSWLVKQCYNDEGATNTGTKVPTISISSQRIQIALAATIPGVKMFTHDITQPYIQSRSTLERNVFIKAQTEMDLPTGSVLRVVKPLYGIVEACLHWYITDLFHHINNMGIPRSKSDPCLLIKITNRKLNGAIALQVDDSLGFGGDEFLRQEEAALTEFIFKHRALITDEWIYFNGIREKKVKVTICMNQQHKVETLGTATNQKEFYSHSTLFQYIPVTTRPDLCAPTQLLASGNKPSTAQEYKYLAKATKFLKETKVDGLNFNLLDLPTVNISRATDSSFATAEGLPSQLGYFIMLTYGAGNFNVVHYGTARCQRITRLVMSAEIDALILGLDKSYVLRDLVARSSGTNSLNNGISRQPYIV